MNEGATHKNQNKAKIIPVKLGNLPHYKLSSINFVLFTKQTHFLLLKSAQSVIRRGGVVAILQNKAKYPHFQSDIKGCQKNKPKIQAPSVPAASKQSEDGSDGIMDLTKQTQLRKIVTPNPFTGEGAVYSGATGTPIYAFEQTNPKPINHENAKRTQISLFSFEKQGLTKKQTQIKANLGGTFKRQLVGAFYKTKPNGHSNYKKTKRTQTGQCPADFLA